MICQSHFVIGPCFFFPSLLRPSHKYVAQSMFRFPLNYHHWLGSIFPTSPAYVRTKLFYAKFVLPFMFTFLLWYLSNIKYPVLFYNKYLVKFVVNALGYVLMMMLRLYTLIFGASIYRTLQKGNLNLIIVFVAKHQNEQMATHSSPWSTKRIEI